MKQVKTCLFDVDPKAVYEATSVVHSQAAVRVGIGAGVFDGEVCFFPSLSDGEQDTFLWFQGLGSWQHAESGGETCALLTTDVLVSWQLISE